MTLQNIIEEFRKEFEAEGGVCPDYPEYTAQPRDIEDYTEWLRNTLTKALQQEGERVREEIVEWVDTVFDCHQELKDEIIKHLKQP